MVNTGHIKDLTDLLPKYAPNTYKQLTDLNILQSCYIDSKIPLLPLSLNNYACKTYACIDKEYADKYNTYEINTLEEYFALLKQIKQDYSKIVPGYIIARPFPTCLIARMHDYVCLDKKSHLVYRIDDPEMKLMPIEETPEFTSFVLYLNEAYKSGLLTDYNYDDKYATSLWNASTDRGNGSSVKEDGIKEYMSILYPNKYAFRNNAYKYNSIAFNNNSKNIELSLKFFDWINSDEANYRLVNHGIEGVHYTYENNVYKRLIDSEYLTKGSLSYNHKYDFDVTNDVDIKNDSKNLYTPHNGFYPDFDEIEQLYLKRDFNMNKYIGSKIEDGVCDKKLIDEAMEVLKENRDTIVNELQAQLDQWRLYKN